MGITYIVGRSGTGKSAYLYKKVKEKLVKERENKIIVLVPEQYTLQAERDIIERLQVEGIMEVEILSFTRLAYHVLQEVGGLKKVKINEIGKSMVLKKVVKELEDQLTIYKKAVNQNGFIDKLNETITEFKQYDIMPYDLNKNSDAYDNILKFKLQDLALIYNGFNEYLKGKYIDNEDHMDLLIESIEKSRFLEGKEVFIDGFHTFTPQTLRIIDKMMLVSKDIYITATVDLNSSDNDLFFTPLNTLSKLREKANKNNTKERVIDLNKKVKERPIGSSEINHIEKRLFNFPIKPYTENVSNIEIFQASNLYSEVENVASKIISLLRDRDYRYRDIAIVSGNMDIYGPIIKRIFDEYHMPIFIDEKRDIMTNPIIEFILTSIKMVSTGYQYENVFRFIKTGFSSISKDEGEVLENYVLRYGIKGTLWFKDFSIPEGKDLSTLNQIRVKLIEPFRDFETKVKGKKSVREITEALFYFLKNIEIKDALETWIEELKYKGYYDYAHENSQIWNIVMDLFNQLSEILGHTEVRLDEYYKILESGFAASEVGVIPSTVDQILVGNLERSRSQNIKALFVVGVNDGVLPGVYDEAGILLDKEKNTLQENGLVLSPNSDMKMLEEKFAIYTVLSKPTNYLWLSYPLADSEGKALRASILIDQVKKLFPNLKSRGDIIPNEDQQLQLVSKPESTFKYLIENIRKAVDDEKIFEFWWEVYQWYFTHPKWKDEVLNIVSALFYQNQVYSIDGKQKGLFYDKPIKTSVSRLESYMNCPFAHFVQYGLKPQERKEYQLKTPDMGMIFHETIDRFAAITEEKEIDWKHISQEQCYLFIEEIINEVADQFENGLLHSTYSYKYLIKRLERISKRAIWTLIEHIKRGDFTPYGHEVRFGENQSIPPIEVVLENGEVLYLEGRIDRVDVFEDESGEVYYRVIDYKSGNKDLNLSDIYYGFQLQLMIYLDAVMSHDERNIKPGGLFYFKIDDPMIKSVEYDQDKILKEINKKLKMKGLVLNDVNLIQRMDRSIEKHSDIIPVALNKDRGVTKSSSVATEAQFRILLDHTKDLVKNAGHQITEGHIKIEPVKKGKQDACQYCKFSTMCQFDQKFEDNQYKHIKELKDEEVIKILQDKKGGDDNA
ncbi:helicase-exonuclease AddAB subunit AddB [Serpentinicella sp. ANB-PHB4]|uniref:helicase-exonuclease AddAB subunit AddB n=1 Tax=Serpentinicella sp. ANB-PHB4 TaxID=3074076 RepID=UPI00285E4AF7|nr:helicase-exonuclease AddAB subunit AddB [Serpentinicella sp. ANB-PHB4]MDR5659332.1 helicase-exonuclease AddAB subunit AddB [Serpentinicella sp. ANB-PHB4]